MESMINCTPLFRIALDLHIYVVVVVDKDSSLTLEIEPLFISCKRSPITHNK